MEQLEKTQLTAKALFNQDNIKKKFEEMMGKKAQGFITSVLQIVTSNKNLSEADPMSVYHAAAVAATLDLPLNNNLGFAYIVPYNERQKDGSYKQVAQFQMGYKGFIQLAQRSGVFKTISATPIYEGQLVEENPLTGFVFDFTKKKSETVIGYASYFSLLNGFEKTMYMKVDQLTKHGLKYSKTYSNAKTKAFSKWETDFEAMAIKTVLKLLLSKFDPL
jgi:recombination protein RecT